MKFKIKFTLDYIAMYLGVIGSAMVSLPYDWQRLIGFCLFLIANILWLIFCKSKPEFKAVMILNLVYLVTSLMGIWNNS